MFNDHFVLIDYTISDRAAEVLDVSDVASLPYDIEETVNFPNSMEAQLYLNPEPIDMGSADSYAVISAETVTSTGSSVVNGDLGLFPGTSVTGFPPAVVTGVMNIDNALASQAKADLNAASLDASGRAYNQMVTEEIGGQTLNPGVYKSDITLTVTGILSLDCQRNVLNPVWIFQVGSAFSVSVSSKVVFVNCLPRSNPQVWWNVGSSATLNTNSEIVGTIMAYASVTAATGSKSGALMARTAQVALDDSTVYQGSGDWDPVTEL